MRLSILFVIALLFAACKKKENPLEPLTGTYVCDQMCVDTWFYDPGPNSVDTNYYDNLSIVVKLVDDDTNDKLYVDGNIVERNADGNFESTNSPYHRTVSFIGDSIAIVGYRDYRPDSNSKIECVQNGRKQ